MYPDGESNAQPAVRRAVQAAEPLSPPTRLRVALPVVAHLPEELIRLGPRRLRDVLELNSLVTRVREG